MPNHDPHSFESSESGGDSGLELIPSRPGIGQMFIVRFGHFAARAQLLTDDGQSYQVDQCEGVMLRVNNARPLSLRLLDRGGRILGAAEVLPRINKPRLYSFDLPEAIGHGVVSIQGSFRAEHVKLATLSWRCAGEASWSMQTLQGAHFSLPLRTMAGVIEVRLELRSDDAEHSAEAVLVVERLVRVARQAPVVSFAPSCNTVERFAEAHMRVTARHVKRLRSQDGYQIDCPSTQRDTATFTLRIPTAEVGRKRLEVEVESLDGTVRQFVCELDVVPRPVRCTAEAQDDGTLLYSVKNASGLRLDLPSFFRSIELDSFSGRIEHSFITAVQGTLQAIDDGGATHQFSVLLAPPRKELISLPRMTPLAGWRV